MAKARNSKPRQIAFIERFEFKKIKKFVRKTFCNNDPKVACVNLQGIIGRDSKVSSGINYENTLPLLEKAFKIENLKAVAITINSPGGSPVQSELVYNAIRNLAKEHKVTVLTFAHDVAASGGYWLLLAGDEIYAHNSSIIGSIGVIFSGFGFVDLIKKIGVERRVYTEGKNKAILDPFMPEVKENIEILKDAQRDIFECFKDMVRNSRGKKLDKSLKKLGEEKIFSGAFWSGKKAQELGLVDEIADIREKLQQKYGKKVKIINITAKKSWLKSFFSEKVNLADNLVNKFEEKLSFNKFGL